jgi:MFS family permease
MFRTFRDSRTPVLIALILAMALNAMASTIVATAVPHIVADLGRFSLVGWLFSAYLLALTVTVPIYGKLADLYGRKPVLLAGISLFLLGSALSAVAPSMEWLIVFRALQGLGGGAIGATVNTVVGDLYDVRERGKIQGWLSTAWGGSAMLAPLLGGAFAGYASWRWIFLFNLPVGAFALLLLTLRLHERVVRRPHQIDYAGAGLLMVSTALVVLGLLQGGTAWPWWSVPSVAVFAGGVFGILLALWVERRAKEPIMPLWLWSRRITAGSYLATMVSGSLVIGLSMFLPMWGQAVLELSPVVAGFVLSIMSVAWPVASAFSSRLYLRVGFRNTAALGGLLTVIAAVVFLAASPAAPVWHPLVGSLFMGTGLGLISTSLVVGLQTTVGWAERGVVTAGLAFSRYLGQSLGAAAFGAVANSVLLRRLAESPSDLREELPDTLDGVSEALVDGQASAAAERFMETALHASTHAVFIGLLVAALASLLFLAFVPSRFPAAQDADATNT